MMKLFVLVLIAIVSVASAISGEEIARLHSAMRELHAHSKGHVQLESDRVKEMRENLAMAKDELGEFVFSSARSVSSD